MGHFRAFQGARLQGAQAGEHFIFIARELRRRVDDAGDGGGIVGIGIQGNPAGIVHVVYLRAALIPIDPAAPGSIAGGGGHELGHAPIRVMQGDAFLHVHAGVHQAHTAFHALHLGAEHHGREVQHVHAHIQQRASRQFRAADALLVVDGIAQVGGEHPGRADGAGSQQLIQHAAHGHIAGPDGFGDQHAFFLGQGQGMLCLGGGGGKGLFAQYSLAMGYALLDLLPVVGVRSGDVDQIHAIVPEQLPIGAIGLGKALRLREGLCPGLIPGTHGIQFHLVAPGLHQPQGFGHLPGNIARTQDCHIGHPCILLFRLRPCFAKCRWKFP